MDPNSVRRQMSVQLPDKIWIQAHRPDSRHTISPSATLSPTRVPFSSAAGHQLGDVLHPLCDTTEERDEKFISEPGVCRYFCFSPQKSKAVDNELWCSQLETWELFIEAPRFNYSSPKKQDIAELHSYMNHVVFCCISDKWKRKNLGWWLFLHSGEKSIFRLKALALWYVFVSWIVTKALASYGPVNKIILRTNIFRSFAKIPLKMFFSHRGNTFIPLSRHNICGGPSSVKGLDIEHLFPLINYFPNWAGLVWVFFFKARCAICILKS